MYWAKTDDSATARTEQQEQVLAAAKKCFATINTYDYRNLSKLVATDVPCATGKFKSDLREALQEDDHRAGTQGQGQHRPAQVVNRAGVVLGES